ncbi:MAG: carotenoid biosynthesis protein [Candidatus Thorarchaeota archaeon]|nr:carotenoid biosynthesis protein [Candidatus Thorarchaeota archaeon]
MITAVFVILGAITTAALLEMIGPMALPQSIVVMTAAWMGEHYVSGKGYYYYTPYNGLFLGRVPTWIPFMWVVVIQGGLLLFLFVGFHGFAAAIASGLFCGLIDLAFIEPYLSARKSFWHWTPVSNGYFAFIPEQADRFTAPPGNYIVWFVFPVVLNALLILSVMIFGGVMI